MVDWSDPKTLFVFVIHKHLFVICVCVPHFFRSKTNFVGQIKSHSQLKKNLPYRPGFKNWIMCTNVTV